MDKKERKLRIFVDTSVFGGCFDDEFRTASERFFEQVKNGLFTVVVSDTVIKELEKSPEEVKKLFASIPEVALEVVSITAEIENLRDAYLANKIVTEKYFDDAEHIAAATISKTDIIISWNFKHIVNFNRIKKYNGVNLLQGYGELAIHSPSEVIENEG
ncbi:MAG: type II toxin-antitoxin system VapC family toxin [Oligoflexia bacterium]|nr:type II toxin-antitoxin system VapC family toxin [Oligoflexia bacterium]